MTVERKTNYGNIVVQSDAIAVLAGQIITQCYGVVGMASKKVFKDGIAELLKQENYSKGVVVKKTKQGLEIDLYIIVGFGLKISEIVQEAQKKVKYELGKTLLEEVASVNIYVQGVQTIA